MNLTLTLPPDAEKSLLARASARGLPPDVYVRELVERDIASAAPAGAAEELVLAFDRWADSFPETPILSDEAISRSGMYPDRW